MHPCITANVTAQLLTRSSSEHLAFTLTNTDLDCVQFNTNNLVLHRGKSLYLLLALCVVCASTLKCQR